MKNYLLHKLGILIEMFISISPLIILYLFFLGTIWLVVAVIKNAWK